MHECVGAPDRGHCPEPARRPEPAAPPGRSAAPACAPAPSSRSRGLSGLAAALLAAVALTLLLAPLPAAAQTVVTLVSNSGDLSFSSSLRRAQRFTTGSNANGYTLTSVEINSLDIQGDSFTAAVYTILANGTPDSLHASLTAPGSFAAGALTFTDPANTRLDPNTTYSVVMDADAQSVTYQTTSSDSESGESDWEIHDSRDWLIAGNWFLGGNTNVHVIAIKGYANSNTVPGAVELQRDPILVRPPIAGLGDARRQRRPVGHGLPHPQQGEQRDGLVRLE